MANIINAAIIDNGEGGHRDLVFSIEGLVDECAFDMYYFALAAEPLEPKKEARDVLISLFDWWKVAVERAHPGSTIYLPVDISDEYTGCLRIRKTENKLLLAFGSSRIPGWALDLLNPAEFCSSVNDFHQASEGELSVEESELLEDLDRLIAELRA